jgi:hypothetical protein
VSCEATPSSTPPANQQSELKSERTGSMRVSE